MVAYSKKKLIITTILAIGSKFSLARGSFPTKKPWMASSSSHQNKGHWFARNPSLSLAMSQIRGGSDDIPAEAADNDNNNNNVEAGQSEPMTTAAISTTPLEDDSTTAAVAVEEVAPAASVVVQNTKPQVVVNAKWANFMTRVGPAVLMLGSLYVLFSKLGKEGLIWLVPLLQIGMYHEVMHNVLGFGRGSWFLLLPFLLRTHGILQRALGSPLLNLSSFVLYATALITAIMKLNAQEDLTPSIIQSFLSQSIAAIATIVVILCPCKFWIETAEDFGLLWVLFPALLVIINDTMAYVFGMLLGKMPLLRILSPKKTVEGFLGAGFSTLIFASPLLNYLSSKMSSSSTTTGSYKQHAWVLAIYTSLVGPFGGYLASSIKRAHGKKDFGNTIPGHGGLVDRLDCQLITAPFVYYYLQYCKTSVPASTPPPPPIV